MIHRWICVGLFFVSFLFSGATVLGQGWRDFSGYEALVTELGSSLPDGTGIVVSQVEAPIGNGGYKANPSDSDFLNPSKNFIDESGLNNNTSGHANTVATRFFSNQASTVPGVLDIHQYEVNNWLNVATGLTSSAEPAPQPFAVQNHSWIGNGLTVAQVESISARADYMANVNDMNILVGSANAGNLPQLMVQTYNSITVGRLDGVHASGLTQFYGTGRVKPEIVATGNATSFTTPRVSAAATFLREATAGTNANNNQQIKALILGGATKVEFADWSQTDSQPLDTVFGAGALNFFNSYKIFEGGEVDGQTVVPSTAAGHFGWDHGTIQNNETLFYSIDLTEPADHVSILLTWNIDVEDSNPGAQFTPSTTLSNLDLILSGNATAWFSVSPNNNLEHIYARDLPAGNYVVAITSNRTEEFSLAWRAAIENEVSPTALATITGTNSDGNLLSVLVEDESYYEIVPDPIKGENTYRASIEFESASPADMENAIEVNIVAKVGTPNVEQEIELFNYADQIFESFDLSSASFSDESFSAYAVGEMFNFVDPDTGMMRARVTWTQTGPVFQSPWTVRIDKASFTVSQ